MNGKRPVATLWCDSDPLCCALSNRYLFYVLCVKLCKTPPQEQDDAALIAYSDKYADPIITNDQIVDYWKTVADADRQLWGVALGQLVQHSAGVLYEVAFTAPALCQALEQRAQAATRVDNFRRKVSR